MGLANKLLTWIATVLSILWTVFTGIMVVPAFLISQKNGHRVQRIWAKGVLMLNGIRVSYFEMEKLPKDRASVLAPNHQSVFDIVILAAMPLDFKWVAKAELRKVPFIAAALRGMGAYLVTRNRSAHDLNVMKEVEDGLRSGNTVLIFPEGTRTRTGELLPFKKGAFKIAQNTGIPLWPIAIDGAWDIAPPGAIPTHWGHEVFVRIGDPVLVSNNVRLEEAMEAYKGTLTDLLSRTRQSMATRGRCDITPAHRKT